ncbi:MULTISPECIES: porin [Colwellia]|uniref:Porin n=1 Tax=Colwellia marinimaniae TaxID=1513592 RepID=A0ABQ0MQX0_9GAMM|nr:MULTISPECIES: porin [Colwellia]GAW94768.1 porin [Colwellia marinimaniae]
MNFSKKVLLVSMFYTATVPAMAASVDIYGRADVSVQSSDDGDGRFTEIKSNASRLGFKGTHELSEGLEVVYKAEFEVDIDGDGETFKTRNQYIGLRGFFGEVLLGKNDTMLKQSQGKVDIFSDYNGDIKHLWVGENRLSDTISYKSPKFKGLQFGLTYMAEDEIDAEDAYSMAVFYGDKNLKKSNIYAAVAFDSDVKGKSKDGAVSGHFETMRVTVSGKIAGVTLGLMLQNQEEIATGAEMDGVMVSAKYSFDNITLKGQFQAADHKVGDSRNGITAGIDYKLAKSTKLYVFYTSFDLDSANDEDYLAAGIQYKF